MIVTTPSTEGPRLDDLALESQRADAEHRYLFAPHGTKRQREIELRRLATEQLRREVQTHQKPTQKPAKKKRRAK